MRKSLLNDLSTVLDKNLTNEQERQNLQQDLEFLKQMRETWQLVVRTVIKSATVILVTAALTATWFGAISLYQQYN